MIRALNDMLYSAQLNAGELHAVTQGMSDGEKSIQEEKAKYKPGPSGLTTLERFERSYKVNEETGCWDWQNYTKAHGYGYIWTGTSDGKNISAFAHRWSYEHFKGEIPDGLQIDHLCRNRACVNPAHLEAVTCKENLHRGHGLTATRLNQTHCIRGHEFTAENTYIRVNGCRTCRECTRLRAKGKYWEQKELDAVQTLEINDEPERIVTLRVGPKAVEVLTSGLGHEAKSRFLWEFSDWPKPTITHNGLIRVPDPDGSEHLIDHTRHGWGDAFKCDLHGFCWATHSAERAYRINSGLHYEANTGDSFHSIRVVEPLD